MITLVQLITNIFPFCLSVSKKAGSQTSTLFCQGKFKAIGVPLNDNTSGVYHNMLLPYLSLFTEAASKNKYFVVQGERKVIKSASITVNLTCNVNTYNPWR